MNADGVYVLDSYALLAYLQNELSASHVAKVLVQAENLETRLLLSIINFGEVAYLIERENGLTEAQAAIAAIDQLPITVIDAGRELTFAAAHIKANFALSYADAFAVALAQREGATVLTGDPEFEKVHSLIKIQWLPRG